MKRCKKESTTISCEKCPYISNDKLNLNDALECMEMNFPEVMGAFYKENNLSKTGEGPGGGELNGPSIKFLLREESLLQLEERQICRILSLQLQEGRKDPWLQGQNIHWDS